MSRRARWRHGSARRRRARQRACWRRGSARRVRRRWRGSRRVGNAGRRAGRLAAIQYGRQHDLPLNENIDEY